MASMPNSLASDLDSFRGARSELGRHAEAIAAYKKGIALDPIDVAGQKAKDALERLWIPKAKKTIDKI